MVRIGQQEEACVSPIRTPLSSHVASCSTNLCIEILDLLALFVLVHIRQHLSVVKHLTNKLIPQVYFSEFLAFLKPSQ